MEKDALYSSSLSFYRTGASNTNNDKNNAENDESKTERASNLRLNKQASVSQALVGGQTLPEALTAEQEPSYYNDRLT
jgi:hypothetical protein